MENNEAMESENTPNEVETDTNSEEADTSQNTQDEAKPNLTPEQKGKLESFDRIYSENKILKEKIAKISPKKEEGVNKWGAPSDPLEVVKLGRVLKDYNEDETDFIIRNAPTKDIDGIMKAEKDPWVQSAIKFQRDKVENEKKIPGSTSTDFSSPEKKISKDTSEEEVDKILKERFKKSQESSKSV